MIYIFWTSSSEEEAKRIGKKILEKRLAACVSFFGPIRSIYWWEGKIEEAEEIKVIFKTTASYFNASLT